MSACNDGNFYLVTWNIYYELREKRMPPQHWFAFFPKIFYWVFRELYDFSVLESLRGIFCSFYKLGHTIVNIHQWNDVVVVLHNESFERFTRIFPIKSCTRITFSILCVNLYQLKSQQTYNLPIKFSTTFFLLNECILLLVLYMCGVWS